MGDTSGRFELVRVTAIEWVIRDGRYRTTDQRSTVARIWEVDANEFEVTWMRDLPLPTSYASATDVLEDLCAVRRHSKPVPIAHFPPTRPPAGGSDQSTRQA
jgi:hypothetical protein